jgi:hypothetical protein
LIHPNSPINGDLMSEQVRRPAGDLPVLPYIFERDGEATV